ncbi:MAG: hypothetical protein A3A86_04285 [Elusimicrobia bacterium RIFCSPLOWO2_01_FULL_60_11]|nr:MAG: hypothetical protein A3A86_04285 [Elusimicrobia bacterium RIFCSPLOWO2_01_FULL_60_11]
MKLTRNSWILLGILAFGAFVRFWGIGWGLPYEYQAEEYKIIKYAFRMGSGDLNPHFFEYPSLYLYFMLFLFGQYYLVGRLFGLFATTHEFALSFVKDPTPFYLMGRVSEAVFGVVILYIVYRIGKRLFSENAGLCSALIVAALPNFVYLGHIVKGYMGMILLLLLVFWNIIKAAEEEDKKAYLWAGALLGLAVSTKYTAAPFGIVIPLAYFFFSKKIPFSTFVLSLLLIPALFIMTTPYAVITPSELWRDLGGNIHVYSKFSGQETSLLSRFGLIFERLFLYMGDVHAPALLGGFCTAGFLYSMFRWEKKHLLALVPIAAYLLMVGNYNHPAAGYLIQVIPIFVIWGVHGIFTFCSRQRNALKLAVLLVFGFAIGWNCWEGVSYAYSFTVKDTRTEAKEWIDANIPAGSKILIDSKVDMPPLLMSYAQLKKFHDKAIEMNNYKKEYLALQLEAHPGEGHGYEILTLQKDYRQIGSLEHQVKDVQALQDLQPVNGDLKALRKQGVQYVIYNESVVHGSVLRHDEGIEDFYRALDKEAIPLKVFNPRFRIYHAATIRIYKL